MQTLSNLCPNLIEYLVLSMKRHRAVFFVCVFWSPQTIPFHIFPLFFCLKFHSNYFNKRNNKSITDSQSCCFFFFTNIFTTFIEKTHPVIHHHGFRVRVPCFMSSINLKRVVMKLNKRITNKDFKLRGTMSSNEEETQQLTRKQCWSGSVHFCAASGIVRLVGAS